MYRSLLLISLTVACTPATENERPAKKSANAMGASPASVVANPSTPMASNPNPPVPMTTPSAFNMPGMEPQPGMVPEPETVDIPAQVTGSFLKCVAPIKVAAREVDVLCAHKEKDTDKNIDPNIYKSHEWTFVKIAGYTAVPKPAPAESGYQVTFDLKAENGMIDFNNTKFNFRLDMVDQSGKKEFAEGPAKFILGFLPKIP